MVRRWIVGAAVVLLTGTAAQGQQQNEIEQVKGRQRISMMEAVLQRAVSNGADNMLRQMKTVMPDAPMLTGEPEVRGFRLDGYGVFFDVEVPALRLPVTWPLRYMLRDTRGTMQVVEELKAMMMELDARQRERVAQMVRQLELQGQQGPGALRTVSGLTTSTPLPSQPPAIDPAAFDDPNERYTQEVKAALIDAMIEHSLPMALGADEWLTVAARDNVPRDPLIPGDTADFSTVIFRLKGSDLTAFRAGRLTLDEVRHKVEVREY